MVKIDILYEGNFRCKAQHVPSGSFIFTDAPWDNFGRGEQFSPTDLCAASLGVCAITTIAIKMKDSDLRFEGTTLNVEKHMTSEPPRKISKIVVNMCFPPDIPQDKKEMLEKIARECPVALSISSEVEKVFNFSYG